MIAALLLFRIIYYLLPLLIALLLLAGNEMALQRATAEWVWKAVGRWSGTLVAGLLAWATLIAGAVLLLSGAMPILHDAAGIAGTDRALAGGRNRRISWAVWSVPCCCCWRWGCRDDSIRLGG